MGHRNIRSGMVVAIAAMLSLHSACAQEAPSSGPGLDYYAQGGVVVDGIAYFASDDGCRRPRTKKSARFPSVVAFDLKDYMKLRSYHVGKTYDSSPLVVQQKDGSWIVIAHEHENQRTVAADRDTGKVEWVSEANQPGFYFFGYSFYERPDKSKIILQAAANGLHAMSSETGEELWFIPARGGGVTPCVDQADGSIYYQSTGKLTKLRAEDGQVLKMVPVPKPNGCISWNTLLVNDKKNPLIVTRWYGLPEWDSAIRVFDTELKLIWEQTGLPSGKKDTLTYAKGLVLTGCGNGWSKNYTGNDWKQIIAYRIADGSVAWKCDLSQHDFTCIPNVPYFGGYFYAESQGSPPVTSKLFRIRAEDGRIEDMLDYGRATTSCATCLIANGRLFSGDLWSDRIILTQITTDTGAEWPGPFGDHQTHQNSAIGENPNRILPLLELKSSFQR